LADAHATLAEAHATLADAHATLADAHATLADAHAHARDAFITFVPEPHSYVITWPVSASAAPVSAAPVSATPVSATHAAVSAAPDAVSAAVSATHAPYTSVTTWLHSHFAAFDADAIICKMQSNSKTWPKSPYFGQTAAEIKAGWAAAGSAAAALGTLMHAQIEAFYNALADTEADTVADTEADIASMSTASQASQASMSIEFQYFLQFHAASQQELTPYRTEWTVFHEEWRLAGSIDMVFTLPDGTFAIYDWKRAKEIKKSTAFGQYAQTPCISHLPDTNFWHYALQLNTYKAILETKYSKRVSRLCLVVLHPNQDTYKVWTVPDLSAEVQALMAERA
jgi:ATP-dependent exoDNAse (exonuclease V) beta subunit